MLSSNNAVRFMETKAKIYPKNGALSDHEVFMCLPCGISDINTMGRVFFVFLLAFAIPCLITAQEILRGEVCVEMEPVYALFLGIPSPIDIATANQWALEDTVYAFSGMIYGWSFEYEPGEVARNLRESLSLTPLGEIDLYDEKLSVTDASIKEDKLFVWTDYKIDQAQQIRILGNRNSNSFKAQAMGFSMLQGEIGITDRRSIKTAALEDAAKRSLRAKIQKTLKNRPKSIHGLISLYDFPVYRMFNGQWAATAKFIIEIKQIENFSAY
ncbi:hypothetical protein FACS1894190_10180 [Spirochaetia bacterium]|nr:hypothetical protein FACS1894190_10180 [Spirochaetia bacterium]